MYVILSLFFVFNWYEVGTRMVFILCFWVVYSISIWCGQMHVLRTKRGVFLSVVLALGLVYDEDV